MLYGELRPKTRETVSRTSYNEGFPIFCNSDSLTLFYLRNLEQLVSLKNRRFRGKIQTSTFSFPSNLGDSDAIGNTNLSDI